ncbi:YhcB family protein [Kushneria phosphatilytica]|uniref:YhcB family protein n=1 Tax=Kushneria phosphatilytica TaxID=657387 RepID=UPI00143AD10C|nr:DUF1043 family protein [Kushneria phosphatilytica]
MSDGTTLWSIALLCLVAGIIIGVVATVLLKRSGSGQQRTRRRLAETELELDRVREQLDRHFSSIGEMARNLERQSNTLRQQIDQSAETLRNHRQTQPQTGPTPENKGDEDSAPLDAPRDYAANAHGTLDENYISRTRARHDQQPDQPSQPPRY